MDITTNVALSRLVAQQRAMDVTANNIANAGTPGFKAERDAVQRLAEPPARAPARRAGGRDHRLHAGSRDLARAARRARCRTPAIRSTSRISGDGYFTVRHRARPAADPRRPVRPDARRHHRRRRRQRAARHQRQADPDRPADTSITIAGDGTLSAARTARSAGSASCSPTDPMQLRAEGGTLFARRRADRAGRRARIVQGAVEESNVQPITGDDADDGRPARSSSSSASSSRPRRDRQQSAIDKILTTHRPSQHPAARQRSTDRCARSISPAPGCRRSRPTSRSSPTTSPT